VVIFAGNSVKRSNADEASEVSHARPAGLGVKGHVTEAAARLQRTGASGARARSQVKCSERRVSGLASDSPHARGFADSNHDALHLIEAHFVESAIAELGRRLGKGDSLKNDLVMSPRTSLPPTTFSEGSRNGTPTGTLHPANDLPWNSGCARQ